MIARDFAGKDIVAGKWAVWASSCGSSPKLEYRFIIKVVGEEVWTATSDKEGAKVTKVFINSKLLMIGDNKVMGG